jgi:hypothetical protein
MGLRAGDGGTADLKVSRANFALFLALLAMACAFSPISLILTSSKSREILGTRETHSVDLAKTVAESDLGGLRGQAFFLWFVDNLEGRCGIAGLGVLEFSKG